MSNQSQISHPLKRKGTSQEERFPTTLQPNYVKLDERNMLDLIAQSAELSKYIQFYAYNSTSASGTWQSFFEEIYDFNTHQCKIKSFEELETSSTTSPHLALFIAFLKLFEITTQNLNQLTEKHLTFFYEKVLQLKHQAPMADQVVVFGELSTGTNDLLIAKNLKLKAGKDTDGNDRFYTTIDDVVLNHAQIEDLKNISLYEQKITQRVQANSEDGKGKAITKTPKSWATFGDTADEHATLGFAISSPLFVLEEGIRTITFKSTSLSKLSNLNDFECYITTEKDWTKAEITSNKIILDSTFPKTVNYNTKTHGGNYAKEYPIFKFLLKDNISYQKYSTIQVDFEITIEVKDIKSLRLQNDLGKIDTSKSFYPFGNNPQSTVSELFIGYPNVFNKYLVSTKINNTSESTLQYLSNNEWKADLPKSFEIAFEEEFSSTTKNNYAKLIYTGSYTREAYISDIINAVIKKGDKPVVIKKDAIPTWKNVTLDYTQKFKITDNEAYSFFHIHPFGVEKQTTINTLLPKYPTASYLLIGISNLKYGQTISVHFQMHEGSGNPDLELPKAKWNAVSNNEFKELEKIEIIKDTTVGFSQSGIIQFALKEDKFDANTILDNSKVWLAAVVDHNYDAIPQMIAIKAQAFEAKYDTINNAKTEKILANEITKFEIPIFGLKNISQPYNSYGGRLQETSIVFKTRVSEHLRHKGVAINIFDYERLVLQAFPNLHKVKCISHANKESQLVPGNVSIIVLPKLDLDGTQNDLQPKVSIGEREKIKAFLSTKISPFINLEVRNPDYETIKVEVNVTYHLQYSDKDYYNQVLNQRLQKLISPWLNNREQISFNEGLQISKVINFIEEQEFVDYITYFALYMNNERVENEVIINSESVILTSVENHTIKNDELC